MATTRRIRQSTWVVLWLVLGLILAACGGSDGQATTTVEQADELTSVEETSPDVEADGVEADAETVESTEDADTSAPTTAPPASEDANAETAEPANAETSALPEELRGVLESTTGETVDLATLRGQDVVLWFWAPW